MKLPIDKIRIGERQRLTIGDLSDLDSMADPEVGLIQPIIVHKTLVGYELVAGRRRLAKAVILGWKEVEVLEKDTLTEVQKNKMELFEDVGRTDRSWQDRCLSVAKLHYLMKSEKNSDGEAWTTKHTSIATGFGAGATIIRKMLAVAELLSKDPKDTEAWEAKNFSEAYARCIVDRNEMAARAELERRRNVLNQEVAPTPAPPTETEIVWADGVESSPPSGLQSNPDMTPPTRVYIHGRNIDFKDAVPDKHFADHGYYGFIANGIDSHQDWVSNMLSSLRPQGYAILWPKDFADDFIDTLRDYPRTMPWPVIWNQVSIGESTWPFAMNYGVGFIVAGCDQDNHGIVPFPASSVISAVPQEDGVLPSALVTISVKAIAPVNMAIVVVGDIDPIDVLEAGRVPIWFEPDPEKYAAKVLALTKYYEETIPNVAIIQTS